MESIGEKIRSARKKAEMTGEELGRGVGLTKAAISQIERGKNSSVDVDRLCKIADALNDLSILTHYCQACPVRQAVFLRQFPDLNNIRRDPAIIATRLRKEMMEAVTALDTLSERFSDADFKGSPGYMEVFMREMEQVVDAKRCIEILEFELIISGTHSSLDLKKVYERQQKKCIEHGHHKQDLEQG